MLGEHRSPLSIEKSHEYTESGVTIIGINQDEYGRSRYVLVDSDGGANPGLKFPGVRFRAPFNDTESLDDLAKERFEQQTGLTIGPDDWLGLRAIIPTRSRHRGQWMLRNVFLTIVRDLENRVEPDGKRRVYLSEAETGTSFLRKYVIPLERPNSQIPLEWVNPDYKSVERVAAGLVRGFMWSSEECLSYPRIPCFGADPLTKERRYVGFHPSAKDKVQPLGCALGVTSMILFYVPSVGEPEKYILIKRKKDRYPGLVGGKTEALKSAQSKNIDPITCCIVEGREELGFDILPLALNCVTITALETPDPGTHYTSLINYSLAAKVANPLTVHEALKNPKLEEKMECIVTNSRDELLERITEDEFRSPDMRVSAMEFLRKSPGEFVSLMSFVDSGVR